MTTLGDCQMPAPARGPLYTRHRRAAARGVEVPAYNDRVDLCTPDHALDRLTDQLGFHQTPLLLNAVVGVTAALQIHANHEGQAPGQRGQRCMNRHPFRCISHQTPVLLGRQRQCAQFAHQGLRIAQSVELRRRGPWRARDEYAALPEASGTVADMPGLCRKHLLESRQHIGRTAVGGHLVENPQIRAGQLQHLRISIGLLEEVLARDIPDQDAQIGLRSTRQHCSGMGDRHPQQAQQESPHGRLTRFGEQKPINTPRQARPKDLQRRIYTASTRLRPAALAL